MEPQKKMQDPKATPQTASKPAGDRKQSGAQTGQTSTASNRGATQGATPGAGGEKTEGQDLLQQAKQTTGEIVNQVQQRAGSQLSRQKESAASDLSTVVNAVRRLGESLSAEANGPIARYAGEYGDKAANNLERLTTYIREQDPKQLLDDVQNFGRRRPAWLLGGAFLLGFAGARLIKSSMDAGAQQSFNPPAPGRLNVAGRPDVPAKRPSPPSNAL